jgi:hypothetical protein
MVVGFTICLSPLMLWVWISIRARCTTLCNKVCQWLATGRWFSPGPPVSCTNKTDYHDISEILLKVALNTIKQSNKHLFAQHCSLREITRMYNLLWHHWNLNIHVHLKYMVTIIRPYNMVTITTPTVMRVLTSLDQL